MPSIGISTVVWLVCHCHCLCRSALSGPPTLLAHTPDRIDTRPESSAMARRDCPGSRRRRRASGTLRSAVEPAATVRPRAAGGRQGATRADLERATRDHQARRRSRRCSSSGLRRTAGSVLDARTLLPRAPSTSRRGPRRHRYAGRPRAAAVHHQRRLSQGLPVRPVRRAARAGGRGALLVGHDRHAGGRRLHAGRPRHLGRARGAPGVGRRRRAGRRRPGGLWLRHVHRRLWPALRAAAHRRAGGAALRRQHGAPDPVHAGLRHHRAHLHAVVRAAT